MAKLNKKQRVKLRRKHGIHMFSVIQSFRKITNNPETEVSSQEELAELIIEDITGRPKEWWDEFDWEALYAFVMELVKMILDVIISII